MHVPQLREGARTAGPRTTGEVARSAASPGGSPSEISLHRALPCWADGLEKPGFEQPGSEQLLCRQFLPPHNCIVLVQ